MTQITHHSAALQRPVTVPAVFRAAARIVAANGLHQGDYCPDPFNRRSRTPHAARPLSIVAALMCAATGDPHTTSALADDAVATLALRLEVDGETPESDRGRPWMAMHVDAWGDLEGRSAESVVAVLEAAADANEATR